MLFTGKNLNEQIKVQVSATYFARSLNHDKLFAFAGWSPLHGAATSGYFGTVTPPLVRGADVEKRDEYGKTFLVLLLLCWQV